MDYLEKQREEIKELNPDFNGDKVLSALNLIKEKFSYKNTVISYAGHEYICVDLEEHEFESLDETSKKLLELYGLNNNEDYGYYYFFV